MAQLETLFDSREFEYHVGGWLGTIAVMNSVGQLPVDHKRNIRGVDAFMLDICQRIADGEDMTARIRVWLQEHAKNEERIGALVQAGVVSGNHTLEGFSEAFDIFSDEEWFEYMTKETTFGELHPIIAELQAFYAPESVPSSLTFTIPAYQRDIAFYAGLYDQRF